MVASSAIASIDKRGKDGAEMLEAIKQMFFTILDSAKLHDCDFELLRIAMRSDTTA